MRLTVPLMILSLWLMGCSIAYGPKNIRTHICTLNNDLIGGVIAEHIKQTRKDSNDEDEETIKPK